MSSLLNSKQVLIYYPPFFGYGEEIVKKIESMGGKADLINPRIAKTALQRALNKLFPKFFCKLSIRYHMEVLEKISKDKNYDYVLVMEGLPKEILNELRVSFPKARMVCYLADSIKNVPNIINKTKLFDCVLSYDRADCERYGFAFRPLFFIDEYNANHNTTQQTKFDICFIGTCHSDRYYIVNSIKKYCDKEGLTYFIHLYLQSKFMLYYFKMFGKGCKKAKMEHFKFDKLTSGKIASIIEDSQIALDMQHPNNTGLTMRTIEMLGMRKKLITTNSDIVNYDFYRVNNICVIDRKKPLVPRDFFSSPYENVPEYIVDNYSLEAWVIGVLGL